MTRQPHPTFGKLSRLIAQNAGLLRPWKGAAYRVTTLDYPSAKSILLGEGSFLHGGRWNAIGSFRAVYGSTVDTVAVAESCATADLRASAPALSHPTTAGRHRIFAPGGA